MDREILFRGKLVDSGEWIEGSLWNYLGELKILSPANVVGYDVYHDTVGQYTALTDKNGVKIFEGDIVHVHDTMLQCTKPYHEFDGYVDFADGSYRVVCGGVPHYRWIDYDVEVIGNIYDNPELLER